MTSKPTQPLLLRRYSATEKAPSDEDRLVPRDLILEVIHKLETSYGDRQLGGASTKHASYLFENGVVQARDFGQGISNPTLAIYVDSSNGRKALDDLATELGLPN
jgi:hypothetical protein